MTNVPIVVILLVYLAFAALFFFLHSHRQSRFLKLFALAWTIEAARAGLLLAVEWEVHVPDVLWPVDYMAFPVVMWLNLAAVADFVGIRLSRLFSTVFLSASIGLVAANNLIVGPGLVRLGWRRADAGELRLLLDSADVFVPGAVLSLWIAYWLWSYWRHSRLPGAIIAAVAFVLHSAGCLSAPVELALGHSLPGSDLFWLFEVLALSVGSVILVLNRHLADFETAERDVRRLTGLLPICASCKGIRDDKGYWKAVEVYLEDHANVLVSHGICPDCFAKLYPEYVEEKKTPGE